MKTKSILVISMALFCITVNSQLIIENPYPLTKIYCYQNYKLLDEQFMAYTNHAEISMATENLQLANDFKSEFLSKGIYELTKHCFTNENLVLLNNSSDNVKFVLGVIIDHNGNTIANTIELRFRDEEFIKLSKSEVDCLLAFAKTIKYKFNSNNIPKPYNVSFKYNFGKLQYGFKFAY